MPESVIDELERDLWLMNCPRTSDYLLLEVEPYFEGIRAMREE